jgi:hypothetical protein
MTLFAWTEIEGFANIRKYAAAHPEILNGNNIVRYSCKVKLHGQNHAIQCHADGTITAQSRTVELSVEKDNEGFAKWVKANEDYWRANKEQSPTADQRKGMIIFGEWIGPGVQKGVACSEIPKKVFCVFAARPMGEPNPKTVQAETYFNKEGQLAFRENYAYAPDLIVEPTALEALVHSIPDTYVIDWHNVAAMHGSDTRIAARVEVDWTLGDEDLTKQTDKINEWVMAIEAKDPWIARVFGINGTGEGLVFYPISKEHLGYENFKNLTFKAKGDKHRVVKTSAPAQVNVAAAANITAFVEMVLTPARLEQGARAILGEHKHEDSLRCLFCTTGALTYNNKQTGKFLTWITADVQKETQDELEASKLDWKQVSKPLGEKARAWYLAKCKEHMGE